MNKEYKRQFGRWSVHFNVPVQQKQGVTWSHTTALYYEERLLCVFHQHREMTEDQLFDIIFDKGYKLKKEVKIYEIMGL